MGEKTDAVALQQGTSDLTALQGRGEDLVLHEVNTSSVNQSVALHGKAGRLLGAVAGPLAQLPRWIPKLYPCLIISANSLLAQVPITL